MFAASLIAAAVAFQVPPDAATVNPYKVESSYDRIRGYTTEQVDVGTVGKRPDAIDLAVMTTYDGEVRGPLKADAVITFAATAATGRNAAVFRGKVSILADASIVKAELRRDAIDTPGTDFVGWNVPFSEFRKIAKASDVEIGVGFLDVRLTPQQVSALRDFAARLSVDSEAASKLALEHFELLRKREADLHEAMEKAVEEAKAAVAKLPPSRRAKEANAVGVKAVLSGFGPTSAKYNVTPEESRRLANDFPILIDAIQELTESAR